MVKYINVPFNSTSLAIALDEMDSYTIVGRCLSGSRHYSETLSWGEVEKEFNKYVAVVDYFGGGVVEVYSAAGDICRSKVVMNFDF